MRQSVHKVARQKGSPAGARTRAIRGVHQTFPTRRWEAQFRRNGKLHFCWGASTARRKPRARTTA